MLTLIIGNKNYSSWSLRPWLLLRQFNIEFQEVRIPLDTATFSRDVARWSPTLKVPVLHDDKRVIWDSLAICEYVNERFLAGRGWPASLDARAMARCCAAEMHSGFAALRTQLPMNCRRKPNAYRWDSKADRDIERVQQIWRDLRSAYGSDGGFLCGNFSIVDAMFAPMAIRFRSYGVEVDDTAKRWIENIYDLAVMRDWLNAAHNETEKLTSEER